MTLKYIQERTDPNFRSNAQPNALLEKNGELFSDGVDTHIALDPASQMPTYLLWGALIAVGAIIIHHYSLRTQFKKA